MIMPAHRLFQMFVVGGLFILPFSVAHGDAQRVTIIDSRPIFQSDAPIVNFTSSQLFGSAPNGGSGGKSTPPNTTDSKNPCDGKAGGKSANPHTGHPVIIRTGEKIKTETDFLSPALDGLSLVRTYRSATGAYGLFGPDWVSTYDIQMTRSGCYYSPDYGSLCIPTSITLQFPDGALYTYQLNKNSLTWKSSGNDQLGTIRWLYPNAERYVLYYQGGRYSFDLNGLLQRIYNNKGGIVAQLNYTSGYVTSITNTTGETFSLRYTGGVVTSITDPAGQTWTYVSGPGRISAKKQASAVDRS